LTNGKSHRHKQGLAVVVLAAGKGKRMKSPLPKVLHPLQGRPMLEYVLKTATSLRPDRVIVVLGYRAEEVRNRISPLGIEWALQKEQLGTAHAVMQAETQLLNFDGDIVILSGDVPLIRTETVLRLIEVHREAGAAISLISTILQRPSGYGRIIREDDTSLSPGAVTAIREERDASAKEKKILEINVGIYCTNRDFLSKHLKRIERGNEQREYYLTDLVKVATGESLPVACYQFDHPEEVLGINTPRDLENAEKLLTSLKSRPARARHADRSPAL